MNSIHNPKQFDPANYVIVDYFDNKRPEYHFGMSIEVYTQICDLWEKERDRLFPDLQCHKCVHCGNSNVRYVVCAKHEPTDKNVCFGADCAHKLSFANRDELKLAELKAQALLQSQKMKLYLSYKKYVEEHPEVLEAENAVLVNPVHKDNHFAKDVLNKLKMYGSLSDRQLSAVIASLKRDHEFAQRKAAAPIPTAPAPEGRVEVQGTIATIKSQEGAFGFTLKMLVILDTQAKVWVSVPSAIDLRKGDVIAVKASFQRSKDDQFFSFGKRPVVRLIQQVPQ